MIYFLMNYEIKSPLNYLLILSSFFMLLINILIFGLFEHIKQKNSEIAELTLQNQRDADSVEYYKALVSHDEKQKVLIHDIKKHLNAIASLNEQHDSEKIAAYLTHVLGSSELKHSVRVLSLIHISEPTRQAEISYAVFCLKKKKKKNKKKNSLTP